MTISTLKMLSVFFKMRIVCFVLISSTVGYVLSYSIEDTFSWSHYCLFLSGVLFLSSGSLCLNQVQEKATDMLMPRTSQRPLPSGKLNVKVATAISLLNLILGTLILLYLRPITAGIGLVIVTFYNYFYTLHWKKKFAFAAVLGAIPGALPVVLGYSVLASSLWSMECLYLFLLVFLWQMPHFWTLAIHFNNDYRLGGIPVLSVVVGTKRTLFHISLYIFVYISLAVASPWFLIARYGYFFLVLPFAFKVAWEFFKYINATTENTSFTYYPWVNASILVFLLVPVIDKWMWLLDR